MPASLKPWRDFTVPLARGGLVGVRQGHFGDARAVLWCHGTPSCRLEVTAAEAWGRRYGMRLLCLERPGVGLSTPAPGEPLARWADEAVEVLGALGVKRCTVVGVSGGGPYALALAARHPGRVAACVTLAGGGTYHAAPWASGWSDRLPGLLTRRAPWLLAASFWLARVVRWLPVPGRLPRLLRDTFVEATRQSVFGPVEDFRRLNAPWGFELAEVSVPVFLLQGDRDAFVPMRQAELYAGLVPGARLVRLPGQGHTGAALDNLDLVARLLGWQSTRSGR